MIDAIVIAAAIWIGPHQQQAMHVSNRAAAASAARLPVEWEAFEECVSARESSGRWDAQNPTSSAQGRFQFLDSQWRHGGGWNVYKALIRHGYDKPTAKRVLARLHDTPIKRWRPIYQKILFTSVLTSGQGQGWRHWYLAGSRCNNLVPKQEET